MKSTTQNQTDQFYTESIGTETFVQNLKTYLLNPLSSGIAGFAAFFSLIILTQLFTYLLGINESFNVDYNDVIYSCTGFVCAAGARFLEFFSHE